MTNENIFSGLKVVDFASFVAGPGAAVILSDFGADVVKVEPPKGEMWRIGQKIPPQPNSDIAYPFQLSNRNKRSLTLDLKSPSANAVLERLVKWADVFIVNTPHPANAALNVYRSSDGTWFLVVVTPDKIPAVLKAIGREDLLTDPRFSNPKKLAENRLQLTAMLDEIFGSKPMAHWNEIFSGVH